jgi:hypothetical protein
MNNPYKRNHRSVSNGKSSARKLRLDHAMKVLGQQFFEAEHPFLAFLGDDIPEYEVRGVSPERIHAVEWHRPTFVEMVHHNQDALRRGVQVWSEDIVHVVRRLSLSRRRLVPYLDLFGIDGYENTRIIREVSKSLRSGDLLSITAMDARDRLRGKDRPEFLRELVEEASGSVATPTQCIRYQSDTETSSGSPMLLLTIILGRSPFRYEHLNLRKQ